MFHKPAHKDTENPPGQWINKDEVLYEKNESVQPPVVMDNTTELVDNYYSPEVRLSPEFF